MTRLLTYTWLNLIPILAIAGTVTFTIGAATLAGIITAKLLGTWAGIASAATVGGATTTWAAVRWSRLAIVEEAKQ